MKPSTFKRVSLCSTCKYLEAPSIDPELYEDTDILFLGQNPKEIEVKTGRYFTSESKSGAILRKYLTQLDRCGIVYSTGSVFQCQTKEDKAPTKKELSFCAEHLQRTIEISNPKLIVCLGKAATLAVTGINTGVKKLNGRVLRDKKIPILICLHPDYVAYQAFGSVGERIKEFERGILPALSFFDKPKEINIIEAEEIEATDTEVGFDIETDSLNPIGGSIKCYSASDGKDTIFVAMEK